MTSSTGAGDSATPLLTKALSTAIAESQIAPLGDDARDLGKLHVLDTLAAVVASRDLAAAQAARRYAHALTGGTRSNAATILGTTRTAGVTEAVLAGAMTAHAAEINDFVPAVFVQPGPAIVATAVGLAEVRRLSGEELLRGVVIGYEVAVRLPRALGVRNLIQAGIAPHGVVPTFAAAATAASMIRLPGEDVAHVLSYCAQQASGSWQWLLDVEHIEKAFVFAGMGARNGLSSVLMVECGFRGVRDTFDHEQGWLAAPPFLAGDSERSILMDIGLGDSLSKVGFKRYPVGGPAQPAVEALLELQSEAEAASIDRVVIAMPGRWEAFRDAAMPALNLRYLASIILLDGHLDFVAAQSLDRMHDDTDVAALMGRVDVVHDPSQEAQPGEPRRESARVEVRLTDGRRLERYVPHVRGFPSHPMNRLDVEAKATELIASRLGQERAASVVDQCRSIDSLAEGGALAALIAR